jgi:hypothetical protein
MPDLEAGTGYRALALDDLCNAGLELLGRDEQPSLGAITLREFPFAIEQDPKRCFLALGEGEVRRKSVVEEN